MTSFIAIAEVDVRKNNNRTRVGSDVLVTNLGYDPEPLSSAQCSFYQLT